MLIYFVAAMGGAGVAFATGASIGTVVRLKRAGVHPGGADAFRPRS